MWLSRHGAAVIALSLALGATAAQEPKSLKAELDAAFNKGLTLCNQGKTAEGVRHYERAAALAPEVFGPDHVNTAAILNTLAARYLDLARYRDAEPLLRRSLAIREAKLGKDDPAVAQSLNNLGHLCDRLGRHKESEGYYLQSIKIREVRLGKDHALVLDTLSNLASLYNDMGRYTDAEALLIRTLQAREGTLGKNHPSLAIPLNNLGDLYRKMSRLPEAEAIHRRALKIRETALGMNHPEVANSLNNLALVLEEMAGYAEAEALHRRGLAIRESTLGPNHPAVATALANLGNCYAMAGRLPEAEPLLRRGLAIRETALGKDHLRTASAREMLAGLHQKLGRFVEAEATLVSCLKIYEDKLGKDNPEVARTMHNLASLYYDMGRADEARALGQRCLQIAERRLGKDHIQIAKYLNTLGTMCRDDQLAEAESYYLRSLAISEARFGKEYPAVAMVLDNLASVYARLGQPEKADQLQRRSLRINEAKSSPTDHGLQVCLLGLAITNQELGRPAEARAFLDRGLKLAETTQRSILAFSSESAMQSYLAKVGGMEALMLNLAANDPSAAGVPTALTWNLRMKGIALDMLCRYREAQRLLAPDDALGERVSRFRRLKQLLANAALAPPVGLSAEQAARQSEQWRQEADELEAEINRALSAKRHGPEAESEAVDLSAVRRRLGADSALVEYCRVPVLDFKVRRWVKYHYFAFVLTPGDAAPRLIDLGSAKGIDDAVEALRKDFSELPDKLKECESAEEAKEVERKLEKLFQQKSAALAKQLFEPLRPALGSARLIYLAPDAALNRLPFEALVDGAGKYFIETYRFAYLSSGRDLLRPTTNPARGTVVFAAPDYKLDAAERVAQAEKLLDKTGTQVVLAPRSAPTVRSLGWKALPGAAAEATDIQAALKDGAFGPVKTYVGREALEEVLKALPAPRVLHLATHGFFLDREPAPPPAEGDNDAGAGWARGRLRSLDNPLLRSGITLAGANHVGEKAAGPRAEDGWVTAEEIALLDLRGTELVVLSACQSGLGDVKSGEGVYGLRRAFLYAGVRSMVTSLFEVPDRETRELMKRFYRELNAGQGKLASLQTAQRGLLAERRAKQGAGHPFFWASFVLVGNPR